MKGFIVYNTPQLLFCFVKLPAKKCLLFLTIPKYIANIYTYSVATKNFEIQNLSFLTFNNTIPSLNLNNVSLFNDT